MLYSVATIIGTFTFAVAQPIVSIQATAQNRFEISWPVSAADYQLEEASAGKGLVERGVTEVLTPGSVMGDSFLEGSANRVEGIAVLFFEAQKQ